MKSPAHNLLWHFFNKQHCQKTIIAFSEYIMTVILLRLIKKLKRVFLLKEFMHIFFFTTDELLIRCPVFTGFWLCLN
jgi:hypothetical protein